MAIIAPSEYAHSSIPCAAVIVRVRGDVLVVKASGRGRIQMFVSYTNKRLTVTNRAGSKVSVHVNNVLSIHAVANDGTVYSQNI